MMNDEWRMMNGEFGEVFWRIPLFFSPISPFSPINLFFNFPKLLNSYFLGHRDNANFSRNRLSDRGKQHSSFSCRSSEVALLAQRFLETSKALLRNNCYILVHRPAIRGRKNNNHCHSYCLTAPKVRLCGKPSAKRKPEGQVRIFPKNLLSFLPLQICVNPRLSAAKKSFPFFYFFVSPAFFVLLISNR